MTKDELIVALEAAEGSSRELDLEIDWLVNARLRYTSRSGCYGWPNYRSPRLYTASLDAALPEENIVSTFYHNETNNWDVAHRNTEGELYWGEAKTEAIARRIAALKATPDV